MLDSEEFRIQLRVADKVHPVFCKRSEEHLYRKAATAINEKIFQYSAKFSGAKLELKDLLAIVAIHYSVRDQFSKQKEDTSPLFEKIEILNNELEEYLQSVQI